MASQTKGRDDQHVIMLPFMAQGHLRPFMALANLIQQHFNCTITVLSTPLNVQELQATLPAGTSIRLHSLPFHGHDHGLPPGCENTDLVPPHLKLAFIHAAESLRPAFESFLSELLRSQTHRHSVCVISDTIMYWSVESAARFGIYHVNFITSGAFGSSIFASICTHLPHKQTDADPFELPDLPGVFLDRTQLNEYMKEADKTDPWWAFIQMSIELSKKSGGLLINTVEELEKEALDHLRRHSKGVWAVGPLLPRPPLASSLKTTSSTVKEWLNLHPTDSVVYISFGSENFIHPWQMMELAKGLEASGCAFIWVIRPPIGFDISLEIQPEWLPEGFEERVTREKKGLLVRRWAPQLEILSHKSTGAFLSHCGWNSILESLCNGVPIIGWPMAAEQLYNSKQLVEELGVGVEIARGLNGGQIRSEHVAKVVELFMARESVNGMEMREKARRIEVTMKRAARETSACKALENFFQTASSAEPNL